jgi:cell division protein FtsL
MIRFGLVIWLIVVTGVAVGLYHINYRVKELERELTEVRKEIEAERERLHVLEAEWSFLNQPARLSRLARKHLNMDSMEAEQVVSIDQLPPRLHETAPRTLPEDAPADSIPLPQAKPWSLTPKLSSTTPFAPEAER